MGLNAKHTGHIDSVSAEAATSENGKHGADFEVRAVFRTPDKVQAGPIRIGMSARMTIGVYYNPVAIVMPIDAIVSPRAGPAVIVRNPATGLSRHVSVQLGVTVPGGVEVKEGLAPGDRLVLP